MCLGLSLVVDGWLSSIELYLVWFLPIVLGRFDWFCYILSYYFSLLYCYLKDFALKSIMFNLSFGLVSSSESSVFCIETREGFRAIPWIYTTLLCLISRETLEFREWERLSSCSYYFTTVNSFWVILCLSLWTLRCLTELVLAIEFYGGSLGVFKFYNWEEDLSEFKLWMLPLTLRTSICLSSTGYSWSSKSR